MPATPAPSCLHPWVPPSCPSPTGLARFLVPLSGLKGSFYRCPQLLLSLWERDIWLAAGRRTKQVWLPGRADQRAKGQRHPFFKRQELPASWVARFSIVPRPLDRLSCRPPAGTQLSYIITMSQEERGPQRPNVYSEASFKIKANIDKSWPEIQNS